MGVFLKSSFLFPRTGMNAVNLAFSFTPASSLPGGISRAQRLFSAKTDAQILEVLSEHGIKELDMNAFRALKSEYKGRQIMGSSIIAGVSLMAINGQITGNGPQDPAERRRMIKMEHGESIRCGRIVGALLRSGEVWMQVKFQV